MWQADLATLGVDANVIPLPWGDLLTAGRRGELDAYLMGWGFDGRYDPMAYYLFHSHWIPSAYNSYWSGSLQNHWADPDPAQTDAWLWAARTELDPGKMRDAYARHLERFTDQLPSWTYEHDSRTDAYTPVLLNFLPGQATPATWNIEAWGLLANPYDLSVRKALAAGSPAPQPGATIVYEVRVQNYGALTVTNATVLDILPEEVVFVSATPAEDTHDGRTFGWNLGDLEAHSPADPVRVTVRIPNTVTHGTVLSNTVEVYSDQPDSYPANNGFVHVVVVRDDVDVAVTKSGVGQPAVGAEYVYYIDYANWGGAPAEGVILTDTLPGEVQLILADPAPDATNGQVLTWTLPALLGNQWAGQIQLTTEITDTGWVTNTAAITYSGVDVDLKNNRDDHVDEVDDILAPIITQPTQGTTDGTPTVKGLAPSGSVVDVWDVGQIMSPTWVASTTATLSGTFELSLALAEGTYIMQATATKVGETSERSNAATIQVDHNLPLDPDSVSITSRGAEISRGVVRAERRTLAFRLLEIEAELPCSEVPEAHLRVTENGLFTFNIPPASMTLVGPGVYRASFRLWMSEPHSTYDIWMDWECSGVHNTELLLFILIDPDGFLYDQSLFDSGSAISDSLILNGVVTAYVWLNDAWSVWPAGFYGQTNPQATDATTDDGVVVAGYYSFLTPPGQYRIEATAPGYQPFQSGILTVINEPIHLDIGLQPVVGGGGQTASLAYLAESAKEVDKNSVKLGDTLTYDVRLTNSGEWDSGVLHLTDTIPAKTAYVTETLSWSSGEAEYDAGQNAIRWTGIVTAGHSVHVSFQVSVISNAGAPFDIANVAEVDGPAQDLASLGNLRAVATVERSKLSYLPVVVRDHRP